MSLETRIISAAPQKHACDLLALLVREGALGADGDARLQAIDRALGGLVVRAAAEEDFRGREGQQLSLHGGGKLTPKRLVAIGLGKARGADRDRESLRAAAARA